MTSPLKLLSSSERRRLQSGSYELRIEEARQVVLGCMRGRPFEIISTRDTDVVVYSEGLFYRVSLKRDELPEAQLVNVEVFESGHSRSLAEREAQTIADYFLQGSVKTAVAKLEDLISVVPSSQGVSHPVLRVEAAVNYPSVWRRIFKARRLMIEAFVGDKLSSLLESRVRSEDGLDCVLDRLSLVERGVIGAQQILAAHQETELDDVLPLCRMFTEDLLRYLRSVSSLSLQARELTTDSHSCDKLFEILVEALGDCEVASCFVGIVADTLVEAS